MGADGTSAFAIGIPAGRNQNEFEPAHGIVFGQKEPHHVVEDRKWRDVWAAVIYLIHLILVGIVCLFFGITSIVNVNNHNPNVFNIDKWFLQILAVCLLAIVFSFLWLLLVKWYPIKMVTFGLWTSVGICLVVGLTALIGSRGSRLFIVYGCIFILFAMIQVYLAYRIRHRIPFAAAMLHKVIVITGKIPAVYFVSYLAVAITLLWTSLWSFGAAAVLWAPKALGPVYIVLLVISLAWTMEVIKNVVHVTAAGTVATYYFQQHNMPENPTKNALRRACTTSFGSICFGSLAVALLEGLRMLIRTLSGRCNKFVLCCILCLLRLLERAIKYFNRWAFVQVAVYGKNFVTAAKDTWLLFRAKGCEAIVNDDLTGAVLYVGNVISGGLCALLAGLWTYLGFHKSSRGLVTSVSAMSFFIGFMVTHLTSVVVHSGVAAYFVCYAENPVVLQQFDPEFYEVLWTRQQELQQPNEAN